MKLSYQTFQLFFKQQFTISHGSYDFRESVIITISDGKYCGFGEASAIDYYGKSIEQYNLKLQHVAKKIDQINLDEPGAWWEEVFALCGGDLFLTSAIDCALWDLYGKQSGKSLIDILELDKTNIPVSNYTLSIGKTADLIHQVNEIDWPIYKLKLGTTSEIEKLEKLREVSNAEFRVDVNGAWNIDDLNNFEPKLREIGIDYIEQPVKPSDDSQLLRYEGDLPLFADESCQVLSDVEQCSPYYSGINIKLMKCGGISQALKMIEVAQEAGLQIMGGCMTESSIGMSCLAQLAPLFDFIDLDGASLINNDPAGGVIVEKGMILLPSGAGTGAFLK